MQTPNTPTQPPMLVACLCADWCGTCREYQPQFAQLQAKFPGVQFQWIDVEDESDLVDPIEVENFPTLLIAAPDHVLFFGTVTPHLETLQRLIEAQRAPGASALPPEPDRDGLAQRIWQRVFTVK
jgi:thioredoxin 1